MTLRNPDSDMYKFSDEGLLLKCSQDNMVECGKPSYLCIRQDTVSFEAKVKLVTDNLILGLRAGIALFQNNEYHVRFEVSEGIGRVVVVNGGKEEILTAARITDAVVTLVIKVAGTKLSLYTLTEKGMEPFVRNFDVSFLSTEVAGGFVGCTLGIFATDGEERENSEYALFKSFSYDRIEIKNN